VRALELGHQNPLITDSDLDAIRCDPRYDDLLARWDQEMARRHRQAKRNRESAKTD